MRWSLFFTILSLTLGFQGAMLRAQDEIYLIRHAQVNIDKPGCTSSHKTNHYKKEYNLALIIPFDAEAVLVKIDSLDTIDTVFLSPQSRAMQTALQLFGEQVHYRVEPSLKELDYPVVSWPVLRLPTSIWLGISRTTWMLGINNQQKPTFRNEMQRLEVFADELTAFAASHQRTVVVAHGMVNRQLKKILKQKGWRLVENDGHKNLAVNKLVNRRSFDLETTTQTK